MIFWAVFIGAAVGLLSYDKPVWVTFTASLLFVVGIWLQNALKDL